MLFDELAISKEFIKNIKSLRYTKLTQIQEQMIPLVLEGKNIIAQAKTGSGKTASFCIPIIEKLEVKKFRIQILVLAPTRELANQIAQEARQLSRHIHNVKVLTLCGGVAFKPQVISLQHEAHIIIATPGRILKHIREDNINLKHINTLVLDEADRMLDMGFYEDINDIIQSLPVKRQTLLLSATYDDNIKKLANDFMKDPVLIKSEVLHESTIINQTFYKIFNENKSSLIPALISTNKAKSILIFCNMKITCEQLADDLDDLGLDVLSLHSNLEQKDRDEIMVLFSNKSYPILIATDLASRGLHIDNIDLVINYDLAHDINIHTHRIGRTARAGNTGMAISLYQDEDEEKLEDIKSCFADISFEKTSDLSDNLSYNIDSDYRTLYINGGKKQKLRAGDILGALILGVGLVKEDIGKIDSFPFCSYVAIKTAVLNKAYDGLSNTKIKGKYFRIHKK